MQNFGRIKNAFNELLVEEIGKKDAASKATFKKYLKLIKESEILKTQFLVYNNIENRIDEDYRTASHFVQENVSLLQKFKTIDILKENAKLLKLAKEVNCDIDKPYALSAVHESLASLICTKKSPFNIDSLTQEVKVVSEHITSNKPKALVTEAVDLPMGLFANITVDKFNEKYKGLEENDRLVLKSILNANEEQRGVAYKELVKECLTLVNESLGKNQELQQKEKLLLVKEKLLNETEAPKESFIEKISKLAFLKDSLKND